MIGKDLRLAAQLLGEGKAVAIPTETVYGLAANALDPLAVSRVFEIKGRPAFNPLILHIKSIDELSKYTRNVPPLALQLAQNFWPGPLSLLLKKREVVPDLVTAGLDSVVVRVPSHPMTLELLQMLDFPLAAPSANLFKKISPTSPEHVAEAFGNKIPYILDGGKSDLGLESTIISFIGTKPEIMRLGSLDIDEIEKVSGPLLRKVKQNSNPLTPGQLEKHYSPTKALKLVLDIESAMDRHAGMRISAIVFGPHSIDAQYCYNLSEAQDLHEAAANLFEMMHLADADDSELILAERLPDKGLGRAMNDRLERAGF